MANVAEYLGQYASTLEFEDIPAEVIHQAKRTITDTLGCAFGGYHSGPSKIARDLAGLVSSSRPATILCSGQKTSVDLAAFTNDVIIRYLDFNDGYISKGGGHPSDTIAALLAAGEVTHAGGRELIVAAVLSYEVYCRIGDAWNNKASGIDHVTVGGIASVVGVRPFQIMKTHLKQFPLGNWSQTVVTAILEARASVKNVRDVAEIHVHTTQKALNVMADGPEKWNPRNRETADHSIPYTAAVAMMYGTINESYFDEQYFLHNKELLELMGRVKCSASEEANRRDSEFNLCELDVTLRSGERKSVRVEYHRGHWRNPMSDAEVETKFRSLAAAMLPPTKVDALLQQLWKLDDLADVGTLIQMTQNTATD